MQDENSKKKPFFASFLEKQIKDPETIQGGSGIITDMDNDVVTIPSKDNVTAQIFDHVTSPNKDLLVTMKYPSDGDDGVI